VLGSNLERRPLGHDQSDGATRPDEAYAKCGRYAAPHDAPSLRRRLLADLLSRSPVASDLGGSAFACNNAGFEARGLEENRVRRIHASVRFRSGRVVFCFFLFLKGAIARPEVGRSCERSRRRPASGEWVSLFGRRYAEYDRAFLKPDKRLSAITPIGWFITDGLTIAGADRRQGGP